MIAESNPGRASPEIVEDITPFSHLHDTIPSSLPQQSPRKDPPIPIAAKRITTKLPSHINKQQEGVPSVRESVKQFRPKRKPIRTKRIMHHEGAEKEYEGILFTLKGNKRWFIIPPEEKIRPLERPFSLNGAREALAKRQVKSKPLPPTHEQIEEFLKENPDHDTHPLAYEIAHDEQEIFFMAAWYLIRQELIDQEQYSSNDENNADGAPPLCLREIYLNDYGVIYDRQTSEDDKAAQTCGQVDIFGFLPDYQGVIIDFGRPSVNKELQTLRQYHGARAVIADHNHNQTPPITIFIGRYFSDEDGTNIVHLQRPRQYHPESLPPVHERGVSHDFYTPTSLAAD